ncbi:MAG: glycine C-acetyltransferase/8-amino-7-oxononanoate synthase [Verrucomicrobia bacterium]|jgi:8-amino-7-oxononanoate synthase|nr:MAG: glycine C-acetyltransferase/8-amino-7-oxononanoate synthase [Verrucomicrobiota bacterium]
MRTPEEELAEIRARGLWRQVGSFEPVPGSMECLLNGQRLVHWASNDYLGLANSAELQGAFAEAVGRLGAGAGASRLVVGTRPSHLALEEELAAFKGAEAALTFSSGYVTAVSAIPAIVGKGDVVILDKLCHACLIDGARLSGAAIRVFPHNDLEKLRSHLRWARRQIDARGRILIVAESVYSMDGDFGDLGGMVALKEEAGALLLIDEAHGVGLYGPKGEGRVEELGLGNRVELRMGTLSKALGLAGGYLCASRAWIDLLINAGRGWIYSTAPPPAVAEAARCALRMIQGSEGARRRALLWENVAALDQALGRTGLDPSPIRPVVVGEAEAALAWSEALRHRGHHVPAIRFPTVPKGTARLRVSLSADHRLEEVESFARVLRERGCFGD